MAGAQNKHIKSAIKGDGFAEPDEHLGPAGIPRYTGHRDRLRARFRKSGPDGFAEYELLELLLYRFVPRRDTKPIARALLAKFGSLAGVLGAKVNDLAKVSGMGASSALDLKVAAAVNGRILKQQMSEKTILGSEASVIDYCTALMAHETVEQFRMLFLDKKNRLIEDEVQQQGTINHTPVYPREVVKRALELNATALVLVHNHPSGDPSPSVADIEMTRVIIDAALPLGIIVHDHIIIAKDGHASMKGMKLI